MSGMCNIPSYIDDPSYRYKMPKIQTRIEGDRFLTSPVVGGRLLPTLVLEIDWNVFLRMKLPPARKLRHSVPVQPRNLFSQWSLAQFSQCSLAQFSKSDFNDKRVGRKKPSIPREFQLLWISTRVRRPTSAFHKDDQKRLPRLTRIFASWWGRGNGIKTNMVNMVDVARPHLHSSKTFGIRWATFAKVGYLVALVRYFLSGARQFGCAWSFPSTIGNTHPRHAFSCKWGLTTRCGTRTHAQGHTVILQRKSEENENLLFLSCCVYT